MKTFIRLPGILAFVVLTGLIIGGIYLFAEPLIKSGIEKAGTEMAGAKVDVGDVQLHLSPASITLYNMSVTDAEQPMQNLFEFDKAEASIDLLKLVMGQTIINDLELQGLRFETARKTSGAVIKQPDIQEQATEEDSALAQGVESISAALPDADDVLAREPLLVDQRKEEWDTAYAEKKQAWENIQNQLPTEEKLKDYEQRLKTLTKGKVKSLEDFNDRKSKLKALKKEIKADKKTLQLAKEEIKNSKTLLQERLNNLKNAPKEDWDRLRKKYSLDEGGLVNISGLLFGNKITAFTSKGLYWYKKIKPYVEKKAGETSKTEEKKERLAGRFVRFPETNPSPDILIKNAAISATIPQGDIAISIHDLTHQQHITKRPTTAQITSTALDNIKNLELSGTFDHRTTQGKDTIQFTLDDVTVDEIKVSGGSDFPLALSSSMANIKGDILLANEKLSGNIHSDFTQAIFTGEAHSSFAEELLLAIQSIDTFDLDAELSGNLKDLDFSLDSDLDKRLKAAFSDRLDAKKQAFQTKINQQLQAKLASYLGDGKQLDIFDDEENYTQQIENLDKLLEQKLDDYKDQQKKELKDKAKDRLKNLL